MKKLNEALKKEVERTQKNLRTNKQEKFKQSIADWEKDEAFDLTIQRGRSHSCRIRSRKNSTPLKRISSTDSEEEPSAKTVTFLEKGQGGRDSPGSSLGPSQTTQRGKRKPRTRATDRERERDQGKNTRELRASTQKRFPSRDSRYEGD